MNNPEKKAGSPIPGDDVRVQNAGNPTGSTGLGNDATVPSAGASARKTDSTRSGALAAATDQNPSNQQSSNQGGEQQGGANKMLDTALESSKKWIEDSGVLNKVNDLPNNVKEWSTRTLSRVGELSTTQKVVGGAILAAGLGWLALRKGKSSNSDSRSDYGRQSTGSYGRRNYGYQTPDASTSRKPASGAATRSDSGSAYGNSDSRYGGSGSSGSAGSGSYNSGSNYASGSSSSPSQGTGSNTGGQSNRSDSGAGYNPSSTSLGDDYGSRTSESSSRRDDNFRSIE